MGARGRSRHVRPLIENADVVLLVGNRTNQNGTDSWSLYPRGARFIHIDIDGQEIGRNYEALRLVGDAKLTLAALGGALDKNDLSKRRTARPEIERRIAAAREAWTVDMRNVRLDAAPIRPERIMQELDRRLTPDTVVVADASYSSVWVANFLSSRRAGMRFVTPRGLAGLGWGLPFALGAKVARPEAPVFCLVGDGGFGHVWSELETARRMGLSVVVTGSAAPGQMGGHKPKKLIGAHRDWLIERCRARDFTPRGLVGELAERALTVDYHSVWAFVHTEGLSLKKKPHRRRAGSAGRRPAARAVAQPTASR